MRTIILTLSTIAFLAACYEADVAPDSTPIDAGEGTVSWETHEIRCRDLGRLGEYVHHYAPVDAMIVVHGCTRLDVQDPTWGQGCAQLEGPWGGPVYTPRREVLLDIPCDYETITIREVRFGG